MWLPSLSPNALARENLNCFFKEEFDIRVGQMAIRVLILDPFCNMIKASNLDRINSIENDKRILRGNLECAHPN